MLELLISVAAFLVAIGLLVFIHEFGHFWVARRFGIKVVRFSIGFGPSLISWYDKLGTEYVISMIPLGGYVSLFGEKDEMVSLSERQMAFSSRSVWIRISVLIAGPLFNLLFAVFAFWIVFLMGTTVMIPILGNVPKDTAAGLAGFRVGEEIVSIEGKATTSWEEVSLQLFSHMGEDRTVEVQVKEPTKATLQNKHLDIGHLADGTSQSDWLGELGLVPVDPVPAIVGNIVDGLPAFKAGVQPGDQILSVDNNPVYSRTDVIQYIQAHPKQKIVLEVLRAGKKRKLTVVPDLKFSEELKKDVGFVGLEFPALKEFPKELVREQYWGPREALYLAFKRTAEFSILTLEVFKKMIVGKVSVRHISGPLTIAKYAGETATIGIKQFLDFLGMISLSLGVLNLLPIPVLDGGHVMYCVYELITGRRISATTESIATWIGGALLVGFMILAFYNDISHLLLR